MKNKLSIIAQRLLGGSSIAKQKLPTTPDLIERESMVGGQLFGEVPAGTTRQFFYMNNHDWFYISSTKLPDGTIHRTVIRYEVTINGIVKSIDGKGHIVLSDDEYTNFIEATHRYTKAVKERVYQPFKSHYPLAV